jgi:transcriptional regulator
MYRPSLFREDRPDVLAGLIADHPLGLLIRGGASGPIADAVPFLLRGDAIAGARLVAHVARANPLVAEVGEAEPVLVVFQGPQAYVSPAWYATKAETGKVVPTWNYAVVQVHGRLHLRDDPAFVAAQIAELTDAHEGRRAEPWAVADAPADFVAAQMRGIVGVEIEITAIDGKWKTSGNRTAADRAGVVDGLRREGGDVARAMADLVAATDRG